MHNKMSGDYRKNSERLAILFDTNALIEIATSDQISRDAPAESHSIQTREQFFLSALLAVPVERGSRRNPLGGFVGHRLQKLERLNRLNLGVQMKRWLVLREAFLVCKTSVGLLNVT